MLYATFVDFIEQTLFAGTNAEDFSSTQTHSETPQSTYKTQNDTNKNVCHDFSPE